MNKTVQCSQDKELVPFEELVEDFDAAVEEAAEEAVQLGEAEV